MKLGDYETVREIARGGMGAVFEARHRTTGVVYAAKLVLAAGDARARERFRREAELLARCDRHPGIVRVHSFGETESGQLYMILDLVEGESLEAKLEREKTLEPLAAARLVRAVARALGAAHAKGVVHRDVKPSNVLLDAATGEPRLTDFGLAAARDLERLTRTGALVGTLGFLSPEQAWGKRVTPASDVFSLGCVLFYLLAGSAPVEGDTPIAYMSRLTAAAPVPGVRSLAPHVPAALAALLARMLDKDPARRPPDGEALARELDAFLAEPGAAAKERRPRGAKGLVLGAAVALLLAGVVALARPGLDERLLARERVAALGALAQALAGTDDVAALLAGRAALSVASAASESVAWPALSATARAAIARAPEPLGLEIATRALEAAPSGQRDEALVLRARARVDAGDLDGALADLGGARSAAARVLRADLALLGRRASVLPALEGDEPLCAAARAVGRVLSGGDVALARPEVRRLLGDRSDVMALLDEIAARRSLDGVVLRATSRVNATIETRDRPTTFVDPCREATLLLGRAAELPRYADAAGDVAAVASTIELMSRDWRVFYPISGDDEDTHLAELAQLATKLHTAARAVARNDDRITLPADIELHALVRPLGLGPDAPGAERQARLLAWIGKAPPELEPRLRTAVIEWQADAFMLGKAEPPSALLAAIEASLPQLPAPAGPLDPHGVRGRYEALASELCIRCITERPEDAPGLLARAERHLEAARAQGQGPGSIGGVEVARAALELALARKDKVRALEEANRSRMDYDLVLPIRLLVAIVEQRWVDAETGAAEIQKVANTFRVPERFDAASRWFAADAFATFWLSRIGTATGEDALRILKDFDENRSEHPVLLPWVQKAIDEALGK